MAGWLIIFVAIIYFIVGIDLAIKTNYGLSIAFFGYAFANIGLYMLSK